MINRIKNMFREIKEDAVSLSEIVEVSPDEIRDDFLFQLDKPIPNNGEDIVKTLLSNNTYFTGQVVILEYNGIAIPAIFIKKDNEGYKVKIFSTSEFNIIDTVITMNILKFPVVPSITVPTDFMLQVAETYPDMRGSMFFVFNNKTFKLKEV